MGGATTNERFFPSAKNFLEGGGFSVKFLECLQEKTVSGHLGGGVNVVDNYRTHARIHTRFAQSTHEPETETAQKLGSCPFDLHPMLLITSSACVFSGCLPACCFGSSLGS